MHRGYLKALEKLGVQNGGRLIDKTIIVDFLMANFDRHTHNFGLIRDAEELDRYRIAPLFDHGCGFYSRATTTELEQGCYLWESPLPGIPLAAACPRRGLQLVRPLGPWGLRRHHCRGLWRKPRDERALYSGRTEANPSADCHRERLGGRTRHHSARLVADALEA